MGMDGLLAPLNWIYDKHGLVDISHDGSMVLVYMLT